MLSSGANLIWSQNGKKYHFVCDGDSPLDCAQEALNQFQAHIIQLKAQAKAQEEALKAKAEEKAEQKNKIEDFSEVKNVESGT